MVQTSQREGGRGVQHADIQRQRNGGEKETPTVSGKGEMKSRTGFAAAFFKDGLLVWTKGFGC